MMPRVHETFAQIPQVFAEDTSRQHLATRRLIRACEEIARNDPSLLIESSRFYAFGRDELTERLCRAERLPTSESIAYALEALKTTGYLAEGGGQEETLEYFLADKVAIAKTDRDIVTVVNNENCINGSDLAKVLDDLESVKNNSGL